VCDLGGVIEADRLSDVEVERKWSRLRLILMVSHAMKISRNTSTDNCMFSLARRTSFWTHNRAVAGVKLGKVDWNVDNNGTDCK